MMGVPADTREDTAAAEDVDTSKDRAPPEGDNTDVIGAEDVVETTEDGGQFTAKDDVLDENANVDVKVERLQLNGLTEEDGVEDNLQPTADLKKMASGLTNGEDLTSSQNGEQYERGEGEEEAEEQEEEPPEMSPEERKEMHEAVKAGDIDLLEDLLEKPSADINMVYFGENLLVTALRAEQQEMAEFLLDNGVDHNFAATWMHLGAHNSSKASQKKVVEVYKYSCRQMAYDKGFFDVVELIDILNGRLFPGIKPRERIPRYRRPPPTPSRASSSSSPFSGTDASSSSGDESDVSGDAQSSLGMGEDVDAEASSPKTGSTSRDTQDGLLTMPKRRKKKKKKAKETPEAEGEEPHSEKDSGVPEKRKSRSKTKAEDLEKETVSTLAEEDGSSSRRSGGTQAEGDLTDRSKATSKSSEQTREAEGEMGVNDEGYETMSPCPSHPPGARNQQQQQQGPRFQAPSIPVKPNKAFLALRRTTDTHKQHCIPAKYNEAQPLQWRKVKSSGSYEVESPLWHQPSATSPKLPPPTPAGTATTVCMLSPRTGVQSRPEMPDSLVSTIELSTGNVTKPKIMHPSQRVSSGKSSVTAVSSASTAGSSPSITISSTYSPTNDRLYPLQLKVPSYMRMTTSCFVKRRLEPNFTSNYNSLDFVEPSSHGSHSPAGFQSPLGFSSPAGYQSPGFSSPTGMFSGRGRGDPMAKGCRASSEDTSGLNTNSVLAAFSGRQSGGGFPSVLDMSTSISPPLSRKKNCGAGGVGYAERLHRRVDMVPNIRNNSSVIHSSKVTSGSAKVRMVAHWSEQQTAELQAPWFKS